ncbi:MAG TPA: hydrogenase maturation protease [Methylocystis sp.]|nr:hydrogenase maturation protease [Methylocystis sp.]
MNIVVGLGNLARGDDAAGRLIARLLRKDPPAGVEIVECEGEGTALLDAIEAAAAAWLVDACVSGGPPGAVHRFDATAAPLPDLGYGLSTHGFGLVEAIELARALARLPKRCVVYAIEGASFDAGAPLSPPVAKAVAEVARRLREEIVEATARESAIRPPRS